MIALGSVGLPAEVIKKYRIFGKVWHEWNGYWNLQQKVASPSIRSMHYEEHIKFVTRAVSTKT
jgi:hypothetical protein